MSTQPTGSFYERARQLPSKRVQTDFRTYS